MTDISRCTFAMIKPHIVKENKIGEVLAEIEKGGFIVKMIYKSDDPLSIEEAEVFYEVHKDKPFYKNLCKIMSEAPVVALSLEHKDEKKNSVKSFRELLGNTDPKKAEPGTLRAKFGKDLDYNAVHGSDSAETAMEELGFFFNDEIYSDCCCGCDSECDENCCEK